MTYHKPVLLQACVDGLDIRPEGTYVDVTFGGGGHSRAILEKLGPEGRLFAFDQDPEAVANQPDDPRFTLIRQNFRYLRNSLRMYGVEKVNGILGDLGVSSHQFDTAERGFSWRFDAPLDMRMNPSRPLNADQVLNEYTEEELARVLWSYGEVQRPRMVARKLVEARENESVHTTGELIRILEPLAQRKKAPVFFAQVFQALRIEVNGELDALRDLLEQSLEVLDSGGRLVIISYHSLEDRMVKIFMREGKLDGEADRDFYGNRLVPFKLISRKAIQPGEEEMEENSRARSARLRIAEKI